MSRRRAHIAMAGVPIVSHVLPSIALIRELVARGHRVTYANDPFVADRIESTGAELVPCASALPVADNDWPADPIAAASLFLDDAVQALPRLRAAYDDDPDRNLPELFPISPELRTNMPGIAPSGKDPHFSTVPCKTHTSSSGYRPSV